MNEDDERWARYVAVPVLVLHLPVFAIVAASYWWTREAFASALTFVDSCEHAFSNGERVRDSG